MSETKGEYHAGGLSVGPDTTLTRIQTGTVAVTAGYWSDLEASHREVNEQLAGALREISRLTDELAAAHAENDFLQAAVDAKGIELAKLRRALAL